MNSRAEKWQESLSRELLVRSGVVLHGNVADVTRSSTGGSGWITVSEAVAEELAELGFRDVVRWDRASGVAGVRPQRWEALSRRAVASTPARSGDEASYDLGLGDDAPATPSPSTLSADPLEFFSVVAHALRQPPSDDVAFIIDWSEYLFGQVNSLSEAERGWLTLLGKATRDAPVPPPSSYARMGPRIVLLCRGLSVLPPSLYVDNPTMAEVQVPMPSRVEREQVVLDLSSAFKTEPAPRAHTRALADLVDSLERLGNRDIINLARLSQHQDTPMTPESLVTLYRYGQSESPWEQLDRHKLGDVRGELGRRVVGQDDAIETVSRVLTRAFTGLSGLQHSHKQRTPKGALFFVGPTGVGKTELAKALATFLFGDEDACIRFDMSEYNHDHADQRLVGAPPGYVGFEEGGQLTNAIKARPFSVLLFDEIEKAHGRILDKFLQILEDGRLTDGKGETVLFSDTVIVFTSNIGASEVDPASEDVAGDFRRLVREHFVEHLSRPELLGRIGESNIVPFNFMHDDDFLVKIARSKLEPLRRRLKEKWGITRVDFEDEDAALGAIVAEVDRTSGGRGVLNALSDYLIDPLAGYIFNNVDPPADGEERVLRVLQFRDQAVFDFEVEVL